MRPFLSLALLLFARFLSLCWVTCDRGMQRGLKMCVGLRQELPLHGSLQSREALFKAPSTGQWTRVPHSIMWTPVSLKTMKVVEASSRNLKGPRNYMEYESFPLWTSLLTLVGHILTRNATHLRRRVSSKTKAVIFFSFSLLKLDEATGTALSLSTMRSPRFRRQTFKTDNPRHRDTIRSSML